METQTNPADQLAAAQSVILQQSNYITEVVQLLDLTKHYLRASHMLVRPCIVDAPVDSLVERDLMALAHTLAAFEHWFWDQNDQLLKRHGTLPFLVRNPAPAQAQQQSQQQP